MNEIEIEGDKINIGCLNWWCNDNYSYYLEHDEKDKVYKFY